MQIRFQLRTPGNHRTVTIADLPAVPRIGDHVSLPGEEIARLVHSVTWDIDMNLNAQINVMLRDELR